jgi:hypothetical protein
MRTKQLFHDEELHKGGKYVPVTIRGSRSKMKKEGHVDTENNSS